MSFNVDFTVNRQAIVTAQVSDSVTGKVLWTYSIPYDLATFQSLTNAQIKQQFLDAWQDWKNRLATTPALTPADLLVLADQAQQQDFSAVDQLDATTRKQYLQTMRAKIDDRLSQLP